MRIKENYFLAYTEDKSNHYQIFFASKKKKIF